MDTTFRSKKEARLAIADMLGRALKADCRAVEEIDPSAAKAAEQYRAEAERIRRLLPALPD